MSLRAADREGGPERTDMVRALRQSDARARDATEGPTVTRTIGQPVGGGWVLYETAHRRRLRASMRDLYNACASGDLERPALAYIGGAALNQMTGTTEFDESCGYAVTREGIAPMA